MKHRINKKKRQVEFVSDVRGVSVLAIVGLDGYDYKYYKRDDKWNPTSEFNVHISMNGPLQLTFEETSELFASLEDTIKDAKKILEEM